VQAPADADAVKLDAGRFKKRNCIGRATDHVADGF
jgi:hypothetical protein